MPTPLFRFAAPACVLAASLLSGCAASGPEVAQASAPEAGCTAAVVRTGTNIPRSRCGADSVSDLDGTAVMDAINAHSNRAKSGGM